jgi:hypothetical protein
MSVYRLPEPARGFLVAVHSEQTVIVLENVIQSEIDVAYSEGRIAAMQEAERLMTGGPS